MSVDSPNAASTLEVALVEFEPATLKRGMRYHQQQRVLRLVRASDHKIDAVVRGGSDYKVTLTRHATAWDGRCTCPIGAECKHVVAAMLAWIEHLVQSPVPRKKPAATRAFREEFEPLLAEKLGRTLLAAEGALLHRIDQLFRTLAQNGGLLYSDDLARLGFNSTEARHGAYHLAFDGWWSSAPKSPLELWRYVAYDLETSGIPIPDFIRPITDTAPVRAALDALQRQKTVARWQDRFAALERHQTALASGSAAAPPLEPLQVRLRIGETQWALEKRAHDGEAWTTATRLWLDQVLRGGPAMLARYELNGAASAFLALCQQEHQRFHQLRIARDDPQARALAHRLISHPLARSLVVDAAGEPLGFAAAPLVWSLTASERAIDYVLALQLPDGRPLAPTAMHLAGTPDYYLHAGCIWRGPPPLDGSSSAAAIVPAEVIDRPATLALLRRLGTRLPEHLAARFVDVTLRPRFECSLIDDFGQEVLAIRLCGTIAGRNETVELTSSGWEGDLEDLDAKPAPGRPVPVYHFSALEDAANRLASLRLLYSREHEAWLRRFTRALPEEFLAWREKLPPEIEVVATGELASLFGGPVRARIDFNLIESDVQRDWFDLALALKPEDSTLTAAEIALLLRARGKLVRLPGKGWRRLEVQIDAEPAAALEAVGFDSSSLAEAALAGESHRLHALQLAHSAIAERLSASEAALLTERAAALARLEPPAVPASLRATLRPYQREGFHFLAFLSTNRLGGILADDMGLGKTVQTLAWLLWLAEQQPADAPLRVLVVCPKSVVGNWEAETARFAPACTTVRFSPAAAEAKPSRGKKSAEVGPPTITIANYTQLRLGADHFTARPWHVVILDEGQFIKTPTSKVAHVARSLRAERRLILTGTPIENRLLDLWSLFAFSLPGLLGTQAAFKRHYDQDNPLALTRLRTRVRHFLLRRTKAQVAADLPARTEEDVFVELEGEQRQLYDAELKRARAALLKVETARQFDQARFNILASLLRLRQICCHPALVDPAQRAASSAKLDELLERVEELRDEGHQVLVFSQFVSMLELIQEKLAAAGIEHLVLTGQTENRDELVRTFQADKTKTVFLLSLKAAGFGLNLTAASYVILYDPWWNPAVEAQAIDRTHRIGQTVPVNAYRLIARGTVEEKIRALQREKSALAGAIVQEESLASVLDLDSLRRILS